MSLAFLVTAANLAEVTVGVEVVDRVRAPRVKGRPKQRQASLGTEKGAGSAEPQALLVQAYVAVAAADYYVVQQLDSQQTAGGYQGAGNAHVLGAGGRVP